MCFTYDDAFTFGATYILPPSHLKVSQQLFIVWSNIENPASPPMYRLGISLKAQVVVCFYPPVKVWVVISDIWFKA
jgi:hypothetical protein